MRFVSAREYRDDPDCRRHVQGALSRPDVVVVHYVEGYYTCEVDELVCIATTPVGTLILLRKDGTATTFNLASDQVRSQHLPFDLFAAGPSDVAEVLAVWNEYKHKRDKAALDETALRREP